MLISCNKRADIEMSISKAMFWRIYKAFAAGSFTYTNISLREYFALESSLNGIFAKWKVEYFTNQHLGLGIFICLIYLNIECVY